MARITRRRFMKRAGAAGTAATAIAAPAIAQSSPELKWRLTASWPKSLDALYGGAEHFARYVAEATDNRFQMQTFAAGEIVPAACRRPTPCPAARSRSATPRPTTMWGKDPTFALCCAVPFGLNGRMQNAWWRDGGGEALVQRLLCQAQHRRPARGQHHGPDGRLVPQGDQHARRPQGPEDAHCRVCRRRDGQGRRRSRSSSPAATSTRRWRRARSTPPSGSAPTTTRSSASTRSPSSTTTRAGGRAAP